MAHLLFPGVPSTLSHLLLQVARIFPELLDMVHHMASNMRIWSSQLTTEIEADAARPPAERAAEVVSAGLGRARRAGWVGTVWVLRLAMWLEGDEVISGGLLFNATHLRAALNLKVPN